MWLFKINSSEKTKKFSSLLKIFVIFAEQNKTTMKKLIIILSLFPSIVCSQTRLDTLILNEVNKYRAENGLNLLTFTAQGQCVAENQKDYMLLTGCVNHEQIEDVDGFKIEPDFAKRNFKCGIDTLDTKTIYMEVLVAVLDTTNASLEDIAIKAVNGWKSSREHNFAILLPMINYVGVSSGTNNKLVEYYEDLYTGKLTMVVTEQKYWFVSLNAYNE